MNPLEKQRFIYGQKKGNKISLCLLMGAGVLFFLTLDFRSSIPLSALLFIIILFCIFHAYRLIKLKSFVELSEQHITLPRSTWDTKPKTFGYIDLNGYELIKLQDETYIMTLIFLNQTIILKSYYLESFENLLEIDRVLKQKCTTSQLVSKTIRNKRIVLTSFVFSIVVLMVLFSFYEASKNTSP